MKRLLALALSLSLSASMLFGCSSSVRNRQPWIAPMSYSASEQEIVELISGPNMQIMLFEYEIGGLFHEFRFWVEAYNYEEPLGTIVSLDTFTDEPNLFQDGMLAVIVNHGEDNTLNWTLSGMGASTFSTSRVMSETPVSSMFALMDKRVAIESGQDIVLAVLIYTTGSSIRTLGDLQQYLDAPGNLSEYTCAYIIKARFSS